ncbi:MAG: helix-turn-helix domain-containing protein [Deltaproteobacteria bacterium]
MSQYPAAALLARLPPPPVAECAARLEFARALFRVGRMADAAQCSLESIPHADEELRFDLGLLHANTEAVAGKTERAIAEAEALVPVLPRQSFARDAHLCRGYALAGRGPEAVGLLERWAARPIPAGVSVPARMQLVHAAGALGYLDTARQTLAAISGDSDYDQWVIWLAWLPLELEAGRLDRAESLGDRLRLEAASDSYLYPMLEHVSIAIAIERGCGAEIVPRVNALMEYLAVRHDVQTLAATGELSDDLATSGFDGISPASSPLLTPDGAYLRWRRETLLQQTSEPPSPDFARVPVAEFPRQAAAQWHAAQAQLDALEGRNDAAAEHLASAIDIARIAGLGRLRFALLRLSAQVAVTAADWDTLARRRDDLRVLAAEMPSRRAGAWANWSDLLCSRDPPPPEEWFGLLAADHEMSRLCAATLGATVALNRWEQVLVAATRRRWNAARYLLRPHAERIDPGQAWAVDFVRDRVFAPGCEPLDLSRAAATRSLLLTLAIEQRASKQELAEHVWGVAEYHRLRDDKRMQVALRKLRLRIEREPSNPKRVVTDDDGYRLSAEAPLIVLAPAELAGRVDASMASDWTPAS